MPPMYCSTGSHLATSALSNGLSAGWLAKRRKYHELSTKVSSVSVSRSAAPPHSGRGDVLPGRVAQQRVAGGGEVDVLGQHDRELRLGHRHHAAGGAVNERDRRAPVALAADAPVAQAPYGLALAPAFGFGADDDRRLGLGHGHPVDEARVDQHPVAGVGLGQRRVGLGRRGGDHAHDRQPVLGGEIEVALVVPGHRHDRAGAVIHQHEVGDVDRQALVGIERMDRADAGVEAELLGGLDLGRGGAACAALLDELGRVAIAHRHGLGQRMVGRDGDEAGAEDRVRPRGVDLDAVAVGQLEAELHALALADPVLLHQPNLVGPSVELAEPGEQILGEIGDPQEPLVELALLDGRARAPTAPVDHLLVGEHGHVDRVPVDRAFLAIDQPRRMEIEEQRLLVSVIGRIARGDLAAPVERESEPPELGLHVGDVLVSPTLGVDALLHRRVLGRHAECVPPHRMEYFVPGHALVAREHVAHRVVAHVADVDAPRRIGEHLKHVALGLVTLAVGLEAARFVPRAASGPSACDGSNRVSLMTCPRIQPGGWQRDGSADRRASQVARLGEDDVLELLHRRRLDRRGDLQHRPGAPRGWRRCAARRRADPGRGW